MRKPVSLMTADQLSCPLNRHEQHMVQQTARFAGLVLFSTGGVVVFYYPPSLKPAARSDETARAGSELIFPSEAHAMKIQSQAGEMSRLGFAWALKALPTAGEIAA